MGVGQGRFAKLNVVNEQIQLPLGAKAAVQLAQGARRRVAGVGKQLFPVFLSGTVQYGDTSIESNKEAYIKLLNDTLADCSEKFGERQPYFVDGYVVPQNKPKQESTNNNNIENNNT